jgi:hypothetical protein
MIATKVLWAVGSLALLMPMAGCDDDDPAIELSPVVLRDDEITNDPKAFDDSRPEGSTDLYDANGCAIGDDDLWLDGRERDRNYVRRVAPDGDDEFVSVGVWQAPPQETQRLLRTVGRQVDKAHCARRPYAHDQVYTGALTPITGLPDGAVGFRNVWLRWPYDTPSKPVSQLDRSMADRRSMMAAYAFTDGYLVFVTLAHFDDTDPEPADVRELLEKAIAKVKANAA